MWEIKMDGDFYWMKYPSVSDYMRIIQAFPEMYGDNVILRHSGSEAQSFFVLSSRIKKFGLADALSDCDVFCYTQDDDEVKQTLRHKNMVSFRPCLIPLDKNGRHMEEIFAKNNPNGTILYGGVLYKNEQPLVPGTIIKDGSPIELGNSNGADDLEWLVFNGILYLTTDVVTVNIEHLESYSDLFELGESQGACFL